MNELISILLPSKNAGKYIKESVESILNQTYQNFELIIVDESTDDSEKIIKSFKSNKIVYQKVINSNIVKSLNLALKLTRGDIIARMDADDISDPRRINIQLKYLINSDIDIVGTNFYCIDEEGKILYEKIMPELHKDIEFMMPIEASLLHPTLLCKKDILINSGGYNNKYSVEDVELFLRLLRNNIKFYNIQQPLHYYRFLKKNKQKIRLYKSERIILGYQYLSDYYKTSKGKNQFNEMNHRYALLEYYNGDLRLARKYFHKIVYKSPQYFIKLIRYTLISLLGNRLVRILRENYLFTKLNRTIIKIFKYDTNRIKRL